MNKIIYRCGIGSQAYGLATPESDTDVRSIFVNTSLQYYFGLKEQTHMNFPEEEDHVGWSLQEFSRLAAQCNTQMLEMLFAPESQVQYVHPAFKVMFIDHRDRFITLKLYNVISGYAHSEYRKALGETTGKLGAVRKEDIAECGYSKRNASHCLRLLWAGAYALKYRRFPVELPPEIQEICMYFKTGTGTKENFENSYDMLLTELEIAHNEALKGPLAREIDYNWLNAALVIVHQEILGVCREYC